MEAPDTALNRFQFLPSYQPLLLFLLLAIMATLSDAPARTLSSITELTAPNSFHTLALPPGDAGAEQDGSRNKSTVNKDSEDIVRQSRPPESFPQVDGSVQSSAVSVCSHLTESRSQIPQPASPSSNQRSFIPIRKLLGDVISPTTASCTTFSSLKAPSPGGLLPPPRSVYSSKPKLVKSIAPPSSPSPYGVISDEARRRYLERYYPHSKQAKALGEQEIKEKESTEKATKVKEMRDKQIEKMLKDKKMKVKFGDQQAQGQSNPTSGIDLTVNAPYVDTNEKAARQRTINTSNRSYFVSPPNSRPHSHASRSSLVSHHFIILRLG